MGNRAVIQMQGQDVGIYLHNNGGRDTIQPLLEVAQEYGIRGDDYGIARLAQMMGNFFGGTLSVGVSTLDKLDSQFNIVDRLFKRSTEQSHWDNAEMKTEIKKANDQFFLASDGSPRMY